MADLLVFSRYGVDFLSFTDLAGRMGVPVPEETAMVAIHDVSRVLARKRGPLYQPFHSNAVAGMLAVTSEERWLCDIRTIGAIDADPEKDAALRAEELRAYEKERSRRRRAAKGAKPRAEYEAESLSKTKQWEIVGMKRSTWYRKGKPQPVPLALAA